VEEIAHAAASQRPPIPPDRTVVRTEGYTYAASVWDVCIVQGPISVAPVPNRTVNDSQLCDLAAGGRGAARGAART
jgi:hypothetical protein